MSEESSRSWDDAVEALRRAANDVRAAVGQSEAENVDQDIASVRLKADIARLEQSAADLRAKVAGGMERQRGDFKTSFDRERARESTEQIRASLDELAALAGTVATEMAAAASASVNHAEPELRNAVRALEDVAGSTASWVRAFIDPGDDRPRNTPSGSQPSLDEL